MSTIDFDNLIATLRQQEKARRIANLTPCCYANWHPKYIDGEMFVCANCGKRRSEMRHERD